MSSEIRNSGETPVYPVIMAGGSGIRFWPMSRKSRPKQFLSLFGGASLLEMTVERMCALAPPNQVVVVTSDALESEVHRLLPTLPRENVLAEPTARNTAAAIGFAAVNLVQRDPDAIMAVMPSDHFIGDSVAFTRVSRAALEYAKEGRIVTLGVTPTRPETGYGYIRFADFVAPPIGGENNESGECRARNIAAFVEKPNSETALGYLKEGRYLWNSGMFFFKAQVILDEMEKFLPDLHAGLLELQEGVHGEQDSETFAARYQTLRSISIDFGVMEHTDKIVVIPANIGWSDVGSWSVFEDVAEKEGANVAKGDCVLLDSADNIAYADTGHVVAALGVEDLVIAVSGGAVLVCPKNRSQEVRRLVEEIRQRGWSRVL